MLLEKWRKPAVDFITVGIWTQSPESGGKFLIVCVCTIGRGGLLLLGGALWNPSSSSYKCSEQEALSPNSCTSKTGLASSGTRLYNLWNKQPYPSFVDAFKRTGDFYSTPSTEGFET